jgi:hypothetical protein
MEANQRAWELKSELFAVLAKFDDFAIELPGAPSDSDYAAKEQASMAANDLRRVYDSLGDFFTDAGRDPKDQSY